MVSGSVLVPEDALSAFCKTAVAPRAPPLPLVETCSTHHPTASRPSRPWASPELLGSAAPLLEHATDVDAARTDQVQLVAGAHLRERLFGSYFLLDIGSYFSHCPDLNCICDAHSPHRTPLNQV